MPKVAEPAPPATPQEPPTAVGAINRYRTWLHLGAGAEDCPDVDEVKHESTCGDPSHFHALCRLPNQFQKRTIDEQALAAKARIQRRLRDPDSTEGTILDDDLGRLERMGELAREELISELIEKDWWKDYLRAADEVRETVTTAEGEKLYEHVEADQDRHQHLSAMPEADRPAEEFAELTKHLENYGKAVQEEQEKIVAPRREALRERDISQLIDQIKEARIEARGSNEFRHVSAVWTWLFGTLRGAKGPQVFPDLAALEDADEEIIDGLAKTFNDLAQTRQGTLGNP